MTAATEVARHPYVVVAAIKEAIDGRETEILDKLGIRWRDGRPHIRCPYLGHLDKNASWRWDTDKRVAFCTCSAPSSVFDVIMRVEGCDFSKAAVRAAELLDRTDLVRSADKTSVRKTVLPGATLAGYAAAKALPKLFLRSLGLTDTIYCPASAPVRRKGPAEEGRVDGPSSPVKERRWDNNPSR